ncbi:phosphoribosyl-AMP cyclohydrolase [Candidatus Vidania fulgoroideorum]
MKLCPILTVNYINNKILFIGWMSLNNLKTSLKYNICCYFSRTNNNNWFKGLKSGNFQIIKKYFYDCDKDSIIFFVKQIGNCCHKNIQSCFYQIKND